MKLFKFVKVFTCSLLMLNSAFGQVNVLEQKPPSPWVKNDSFFRIEYQLRYMMDANINAHDLEEEGVDAGDLSDNLAEVLTSLYGSAIECLKKTPNPRLLTALLRHHEKYLSGSVSEELGEYVEVLKKLEKGIKD